MRAAAPSTHHAERLAAADPVSITSVPDSVPAIPSRETIHNPAGPPKISPQIKPVKNRDPASRRPFGNM
ncbi:hypothetical protein ASG50_05405 [Rhizobium sp. Leaf386]|nr:hypothetical protein ASG50_05405 [Rhizobium sp. Leaf386]